MVPTSESPVSAATSRADSPSQSGQPREHFSTEELVVVLSHYDVGTIESIMEFPRGSRKAPKLLVTSSQGRFLLKRRSPGRDDPFKVAFCHMIQLQLALRQFPLPAIIGTRAENNSMLQSRGHVYELFEYVVGGPFAQTADATQDSGRVLALFHEELDGFHSEFQPSTGSYHRMDYIEQSLQSISSTAGLAELATELLELYRLAGNRAEEAGLAHWPGQVVHADWHPGNMLFRDSQIVAVIDYDSARILSRAIDVANGALQFSVIGGEEDVTRWPDFLDENRYRAFLKGYDGVMLLSKAEMRCLPWLMIEALIAEAAIPIAATGSFGRTEGRSFLQMVLRKANWIETHAGELGVSA